jgi:aspartyl-tRNA(Asn)/glutamyl-tRNA(Gln) amidotransferase subunit C
MEIGDLRETAALAHLNLSEEELNAAFPAFEQMLGYFAAMQAADRDEALAPRGGAPEGMAAVSRVVDSGWFRPDGSADPCPETSNEQLLNNAGERDGRFLVIPNVL